MSKDGEITKKIQNADAATLSRKNKKSEAEKGTDTVKQRVKKDLMARKVVTDESIELARMKELAGITINESNDDAALKKEWLDFEQYRADNDDPRLSDDDEMETKISDGDMYAKICAYIGEDAADQFLECCSQAQTLEECIEMANKCLVNIGMERIKILSVEDTDSDAFTWIVKEW